MKKLEEENHLGALPRASTSQAGDPSQSDCGSESPNILVQSINTPRIQHFMPLLGLTPIIWSFFVFPHQRLSIIPGVTSIYENPAIENAILRLGVFTQYISIATIVVMTGLSTNLRSHRLCCYTAMFVLFALHNPLQSWLEASSEDPSFANLRLHLIVLTLWGIIGFIFLAISYLKDMHWYKILAVGGFSASLLSFWSFAQKVI